MAGQNMHQELRPRGSKCGLFVTARREAMAGRVWRRGLDEGSGSVLYCLCL
jgi:hypothetical protein